MAPMATKGTHCFDALMRAKLGADAALVIDNRAKAETGALHLLEEQHFGAHDARRRASVQKISAINSFFQLNWRCGRGVPCFVTGTI